MGLKHESVSDPSLAESHNANDHILLIQHAEHAQLGTISHEARRLWNLHYLMARSGYIQLRGHHERILRLPVLSSKERLITANDNPDLTLMVYVAGTQMVINSVLTMQHICQEIEAVLGIKLEGRTLGERIKEASEQAELGVSVDESGYSGLREMLTRRDAVEHPKRSNVFNSHPNDWDQVPMNWFLTERAPKSFELWSSWFGNAVEAWKHHPIHEPKRLTLAVERGKKSTRQAKKPPRESAR
jgi:hypothetical protein